jgi:cob(I)alamin adenosyltransferase
MKIYTRTGDKGQTQVYTHEVLKKDKDDSLLQCYGTLDELNSVVGLINALLIEEAKHASPLLTDVSDWLYQVQQDIFAIGFAMSNASQLRDDAVQELETHIDALTALLPPQTSFILPGGHVIAAQTHVARTVARRAERELVSLNKQHELADNVLQYINRLSDFLFVLARAINHALNIEDINVTAS